MFSAKIHRKRKQRIKTFPLDTTEACNPSMIFVITEKMPLYKGGLEQLERDLNNNFTLDKKISGSIYFSVYINCKNYAYAFQVLRGIDDRTDKKLIEALKVLQNWTSGAQKNNPVDCNKTLSFNIKKGVVLVNNK